MHPIYSIYLLTFLSSVHYALVLYVNSSFLKKFMSPEGVGLLFTFGSLLSIFLLLKLSSILKLLGQFKTSLLIFFIDLLAVIVLASIDSPIISYISENIEILKKPLTTVSYYLEKFQFLSVIIFFLAYYLSSISIRYLLDEYLEKFSKDETTGKTRGVFLTIMNLAIDVSPLVVGFLILENDYWKAYIASATLIVMAIFNIILGLNKIPDENYNTPPIQETFMSVWNNKDIFSIFMAGLLLEFFYSWMVIYTPIYLVEQIGFKWSETGIIFTIMLLPFVLFEYPLGKLADKKYGEKEILTLGFIIISLSTAVLTFITAKSIFIWATALFITRIGASAIEIMTETYFFKKIGAANSDILGFFRNSRPIAYVIGPAIATVVLSILDFKYIFFVLGCIMLVGIKYSTSITDTK